MLRGLIRGVSAVALACACTLALAQDATLNRARQLVEQKQFQQAYQLLSPLEEARAGDPEYDFLLGLAAIDSGQLTRGVFALERVLAVQPDNARARAEIARAYFLMGENKAARDEFTSVQQQKPPAEVLATIDRFLDALDARERSKHTGITAYLETGLGYDSNVNSATSSTSFAVPAFGGATFTLSPTSAKQNDAFWTLAGGVSGRYGINDSVGLIGAASFDQKRNAAQEQFDTGSWNLSGGVSIRKEAGEEWVAAVQAQRYDVENNRFRDALGVVGQWKKNVTQSDQASAYIQHSRLTYPGQDFRKVFRTVVGGALAHAYGGPRNAASFAGGYVGQEDPTGDGNPEVGHKLFGVRAGGQYSIDDKWTASGSASFEHRRYGGEEPLFLRKRKDRELQFRAQVAYSADRNWSVIPSVTYTHTKSTIVVNEYNRLMMQVVARYDFR